MGSSSSSSSSHENPNVEVNERFHFQFTDCSCQCNANRKRAIGGGDHDPPQVAFMNAFMTPINRSQYDIQCDCDCGEGVKLGFLFGNTSSKIDN